MIAQELLTDAETATIRFYKVTGPNGEPIHGGTGRWSLPNGDTPGNWWDVETVQACRTGLHLTDAEHLSTWLPGYGDPVVWRAETRGPVYRAGPEKYVCGSARLLPRRMAKGPSLETLRARRDTAMARAERRTRRADATLARDAGPGWAAYLRAVSAQGLRDVAPRLRAILEAYQSERAAATADADTAMAKYRATERTALIPED